MANEVHEPLMAENDRQTCRQLAAGEPPYSQRATVLLALDAGATLEEAASQSGLTLNQVKYWRGRFRNSGLSVFPEGLVVEAVNAPVPTEEETVVATEEAETKPKKSAKSEKKTKSKGKKKSKKAGKDGKSKKQGKADKKAKKGKKKSGKGKKSSKKNGK